MLAQAYLGGFELLVVTWLATLATGGRLFVRATKEQRVRRFVGLLLLGLSIGAFVYVMVLSLFQEFST
jgi:hypothetical protein